MSIIRAFKKANLEDCTYDYICDEALEIQKKYNLDNIQLNMYNYLCQGDFSSRNGDLQMFFDPNNKGLGWDNSRNYVEKKLKILIKNGLIKVKKGVHDCYDPKYTSWYFYDTRYELNDLIDDWQVTPYGAKAQKIIKKNKNIVTINILKIEKCRETSAQTDDITKKYKSIINKDIILKKVYYDIYELYNNDIKITLENYNKFTLEFFCKDCCMLCPNETAPQMFIEYIIKDSTK